MKIAWTQLACFACAKLHMLSTNAESCTGKMSVDIMNSLQQVLVPAACDASVWDQ